MAVNYFSQYTNKTNLTFLGTQEFVGYDPAVTTSASNLRISGANYLLWIQGQLVYGTPIPVLADSSTGSSDDTINPYTITALTDSTTGTPATTITDVGASFSQATLNNNFASLTQAINEIKTALNGAGGNDNLASLTAKINAIHAALLNAGLITTS